MEMQPFIGTKVVSAKKMSLGDYNKYRGWQLPAGEDPYAPGVLVEYHDGGKPNDPRHTGYISWSPLDVFTRHYRSLNGGLSISAAIEALKLGKRITRRGWNGKGMYLYLVAPGRYPPTTPAGRRISEGQKDGCVPYQSYIAMFTVDQDVVPWTCSQGDLLADDWVVLA